MANEIVARIRDKGRNIVDFVYTGAPSAALSAGLSSTYYDSVAGASYELTATGWVQTANAGDAAPPSGTAGGDLGGTFPNPLVTGLYGNPITNATPVVNGFLKWASSLWQAALLALADLPGQISTTKKFLTSAGNGTTAGVPFYDTLGASDIPSIPASKLSATGTQDATHFLRGDNTWAVPAGGSGSARTTLAFTTASIAAGATGTGSVTAPKGCAIYRIAADNSCRVRLYTTAAARDADVAAARATTALPTPGTGVLADSGLAVANSHTQPQSPAVVAYNDDGTPAGTLYYAVDSYMTGTTAFTVTLTYVPLEA